MIIFLICFAIISVYSKVLDLHRQFESYIKEFNKPYSSKDSEYHERYHNFVSNVKEIKLFNELYSPRTVYGLNDFSDMSRVEFESKVLMAPQDVRMFEIEPNVGFDLVPEELPKNYNWTDHGAVTQPRGQGMCGSCWDFSAVGNLEGQWFLAGNDLVDLSEQQVLDCDHGSCAGGMPSSAWAYIKTAGGIELYEDYPYVAKQNECTADEKKFVPGLTIKSTISLPSRNVTAISTWMYKNGPVSAGLDARLLMSYSGGIFHPPANMCSGVITHSVLLVGWGEEKIGGEEVPYWVVKNSFGKNWGEHGFFRIFKGNNTCSIESMAISSQV